MTKPLSVVVGVDVGGTNTDAVVVSKAKGQGHQILAEAKHLTTSDVTTGVRNVVLTVLRQAKAAHGDVSVSQVNVGTTHLVNAVLQNKGLGRVAVIRLCGPSSRALPPLSDFPRALRDSVLGSYHLVQGGYRVDGRLIAEVDREEVARVVEGVRAEGVAGIVVSGVFAPTRHDQERQVADLISELYPEASVTLSHSLGHVGLLERENASVLNESLKAVCRRTVGGLQVGLAEVGVVCPLFLTHNDGTLVSTSHAVDKPVLTFASGPTNSMRGAAYLCGLQDAVIVDVGGTTTDVGVLHKGFPRVATFDVRVAGVRTNFSMPDVRSVGLGGGSYVTRRDDVTVDVGPLSAGYRLKEEALVFGSTEANSSPTSGRVVTATDVAVAAGLMHLGNKELVANLDPADVTSALQRMRQIVEDAIDSVRVSDDPLPVVLVGGASSLIDTKVKMRGIETMVRPDHYGVANAIGAALSQVSGDVDTVVLLDSCLDNNDVTRDTELAVKDLAPDADEAEVDKVRQAVRKGHVDGARQRTVTALCQEAKVMAVSAGADPETLDIVELHEVSLTYMPGSATRITVKAVGDLVNPDLGQTTLTPWVEPPGTVVKETDPTSDVSKQTCSVTGQSLQTTSGADNLDAEVTWVNLTPTRPRVDPATGDWMVGEWDLECIAVGAGILGSGGGGSPYTGKVRARQALEEGQEIRIVSAERLTSRCRDAGNDVSSDVLVAVGFFGAPLVLYEQGTSGTEVSGAFRCLQQLYTTGGYTEGGLTHREGVEVKDEDGVVYIDDYQPTGDKPTGGRKADGVAVGDTRVAGVLCAEVGGLNAIEPLLVSAQLGVPALDGDCVGRAVPMLHMMLPFIDGQPPYPCAMVNDQGRRSVVLRSEDSRQVEDHFRRVVTEMGSAAGVVVAPVPLSTAHHSLILRSYSRAWTIGDSILRARKDKRCPLEALRAVAEAQVLVVGKIRDVRRETTGGFCPGCLLVEGGTYTPGGKGQGGGQGPLLHVRLEFQNENLVARRVDETGAVLETLAAVPDIICVVDSETAEPVATEEVRYGQRVAVVALPAPPALTSQRALHVVGPAAFGLHDVDYRPVGGYRDPHPLAPV